MESRWRGSNPRLPGPKPGALPTALHLEMKTTKQTKRTVGWVVPRVLKLCLSWPEFYNFSWQSCSGLVPVHLPTVSPRVPLSRVFFFFALVTLTATSIVQLFLSGFVSSEGDSGFPVKFILSDFTRERCACNNALLCSFVFGSPPDIPDTLKCLSEKKEK